MQQILINFILFQIGWFACVMSSAAGTPLLGVTLSIFIIIYHLSTSHSPANESLLISVAVVTGLVWDSLLVALNWIDYTSGMFSQHMAPYWILMLWALFATTLNRSLQWLQSKPVIAALLGAVAGPLAYLAGEALGAVSFDQANNALIALAAGWAVITPVLLGIAKYLSVNTAAERGL